MQRRQRRLVGFCMTCELQDSIRQLLPYFAPVAKVWNHLFIQQVYKLSRSADCMAWDRGDHSCPPQWLSGKTRSISKRWENWMPFKIIIELSFTHLATLPQQNPMILFVTESGEQLWGGGKMISFWDLLKLWKHTIVSSSQMGGKNPNSMMLLSLWIYSLFLRRVLSDQNTYFGILLCPLTLLYIPHSFNADTSCVFLSLHSFCKCFTNVLYLQGNSFNETQLETFPYHTLVFLKINLALIFLPLASPQ